MINKFNQYAYYLIIGVVSLIMVVFIPMFGSDVGLKWKIPNTTPGWIAWISAKLSVAALNMVLLRCFDSQGKINATKSPLYQGAIEKITNYPREAKISPRSPKEYALAVYGKKGVMLFVGTILGTIGFGQAILVYDIGAFIVQAIALVTGLIAGVFQMFATEEYYTTEFVAYVNKEYGGNQSV